MTTAIPAVRHAPGGGTETAEFIGAQGARVMAVAHVPAHPAEQALIVCPPLYSEQITSYRSTVLLARHLADRGVAVVRFDYRGTGNSDDPDGGHPTFETMRADATLAAEWLRTLTPAPRTSWYGSRLGGLVAATCAASSDGDGLVLSEAAFRGEQYFRELFRARKIANLRSGATGSDGLRDLEAEGVMDAFGYPVAWATYTSFVDRRVGEILGDRPRRVLVVSASGTEPSQHEAAQLEQWRDAAFAVDLVAITQRRSWWFVPDQWEAEEQRGETAELQDAVGSWMLHRERPS